MGYNGPVMDPKAAQPRLLPTWGLLGFIAVTVALVAAERLTTPVPSQELYITLLTRAAVEGQSVEEVVRLAGIPRRAWARAASRWPMDPTTAAALKESLGRALALSPDGPRPAPSASAHP